ncbi:hypothetical protein E6O75_ATG02753 [Venturia nashicola]|uniref:Uncharacterized protein n=1 Tax=Venturia nashicola TaxID=86259 RepID=A0A4Z1P8Z9_9PEZI|nr:hypothetical protein E6O75_ATG02753 [Venturia nashicola]
MFGKLTYLCLFELDAEVGQLSLFLFREAVWLGAMGGSAGDCGVISRSKTPLRLRTRGDLDRSSPPFFSSEAHWYSGAKTTAVTKCQDSHWDSGAKTTAVTKCQDTHWDSGAKTTAVTKCQDTHWAAIWKGVGMEECDLDASGLTCHQVEATLSWGNGVPCVIRKICLTSLDAYLHSKVMARRAYQVSIWFATLLADGGNHRPVDRMKCPSLLPDRHRYLVGNDFVMKEASILLYVLQRWSWTFPSGGRGQSSSLRRPGTVRLNPLAATQECPVMENKTSDGLMESKMGQIGNGSVDDGSLDDGETPREGFSWHCWAHRTQITRQALKKTCTSAIIPEQSLAPMQDRLTMRNPLAIIGMIAIQT